MKVCVKAQAAWSKWQSPPVPSVTSIHRGWDSCSYFQAFTLGLLMKMQDALDCASFVVQKNIFLSNQLFLTQTLLPYRERGSRFQGTHRQEY